MMQMKDCPNCGSFDLRNISSDGQLTWFQCKTCGDEWIEEASGVGFDLADDDSTLSMPFDDRPGWDYRDEHPHGIEY